MAWKDKPNLFDESDDPASFAMGLGHGFIKMKPLPGKYKYTDQNRYYYYPGFVLGYLLKVGVMILAAKYGLGI